MSAAPLVLLAAGGTGGHLFPAEALAHALIRRGISIDLATDARTMRYAFPAQRTHMIRSETFRGRNPVMVARTLALLAAGFVDACRVIGRYQPAAVVGFGGYPTLPTLFAARVRGIPTAIHEQNAVMGRANRLLAPRVTAIATSFDGVLDKEPQLAAKATRTGNPVRPAVIVASSVPYDAPDAGKPLRLLAFGGSQGAKVMSDIVPFAVERLEPSLRARVVVTQQAREEDVERVRAVYAAAGVQADVAPFFSDLPARIGASHLVIGRSGASTVAELAAIGRPAILVPLPHALDQDQRANAGVLERAGGAIRVDQSDFTPERLAADIAALAREPGKLAAMAQAAKSAGAIDAAERLADLVQKVAGLTGQGRRS